MNMSTIARPTLAVAACLCLSALGSRLSAQDAPPATAIQRPTSDLITREQILDTKANSAYEVVESLHNNWYNVRIPAPSTRSNSRADTTQKAAQYTDEANPSGRSAPGASGGIQIYLDGNRVGGTEELKKIRAADVYSIRRYNGTEAQARFGVGHAAGALVVSTMTNGQNTKP